MMAINCQDNYPVSFLLQLSPPDSATYEAGILVIANKCSVIF